MTTKPTTPKRLVFAMREETFSRKSEDGYGRCLGCGAEAHYVEPDAREYTCERCSAPRVYGLEELLIMGRIVLK